MEPPENREFAERLRGAMRRKGMQGKVLAPLVGVVPGTISEWRAGKFVAEGDNLDALAGALGVTSEWLRHGDRQAGAALSASELRGYAIAVRDMLESARVSQQRIIDGLGSLAARPQPIATTPSTQKRPAVIPGVVSPDKKQGARA